MALLLDPQVWIAFATLTALELVLGIDNIIFISILVDKLPPAERDRARRIGLAAAMFMRVGLLLVLAWIVGLTAPLFTVLAEEISGRDVILIGGGLFLLWKSVMEIHQLLEGVEGQRSASVPATFGAVVAQIMVVDLVFSLDSIITAVGMVQRIEVMVAAVIASVRTETPHTIVSDTGSPVTFSSDSISSGASYSFTFTQPGTYAYHCSIHPSMKGTIIVTS